MLSGLYSRLSPFNRVSPTNWDTATPVPQGTTSTSLPPLKLPISSSTSIVFTSSGAWAHGTLLLEARESAHPPSYDLAVSVSTAEEEKRRGGGQLGDGEAFLEVFVEARWNDQELYSEAKVDLRRVGQHDVELRVMTPGMSPSRLASQLSFHITVLFPPSVPTLPLLRTSGSLWRTLGRSSLASVHFAVLSLSTSNAPISLDHARAGSVDLSTSNAGIEGTYDVSRGLRVRTANAGIKGTYTVQDDAELSTTNKDIDCTVSARRIRVDTRNGRIAGSYVARESLKGETTNAAITGDYAAPRGVTLATANARIRADFRAGKELVLRTTNAEIQAKVVLLGEEDRIETEAGKAGENDPGTPPLFPVDEKHRLGAAEDKKGHVKIEAETSNSSVAVEIGAHARGVTFDLVGRTSNAKVELVHVGPYDGTFDISTSNSSASLDFPSDHVARYTSEDKNRLTGTLKSGGGGAPSGRASSMSAHSSNAAVSVEVLR